MTQLPLVASVAAIREWAERMANVAREAGQRRKNVVASAGSSATREVSSVIGGMMAANVELTDDEIRSVRDSLRRNREAFLERAGVTRHTVHRSIAGEPVLSIVRTALLAACDAQERE